MFSVTTLCARAAAVGGNHCAPQQLLRKCGSGGTSVVVTMSSSCRAQRSFMSTQPLSSPDEEPHMILILGKPGGGKGTISGKLLKVCCCCVFWRVRVVRRNMPTKVRCVQMILASYTCGSISRWLFIVFKNCFSKASKSHRLRPSCHSFLQDFPRFHHVSTGDLLRQHVREQTSLGRKAKSYMDEGKLVPDVLMIEVLMEDAAPFIEEGNALLLDGFPRNLEQAKALDEVARIGLVVNLDVPTETIVNRIADR